MIMKIAILTNRKIEEHVSYDVLYALENTMIEKKLGKLIFLEKNIHTMNKILKKFSLKFNILDNKNIKKINSEFDYLFYIAMNHEKLDEFNKLYKNVSIPKIIYCIDTWEPLYDEWEDKIKLANAKYVLFAYKKSAEYFSSKGINTIFFPLSMNDKIFKNYKLSKDIAIMQMGRKNTTLHKYIKEYCNNNKINYKYDYIYEKKKGEVVYPNNKELAMAINRTRIFVVSPQDIDNKIKTGNISPVTPRFYEGMASKTLLFGFKPKDEFDELFPYRNAMIQVNDDCSDLKEKLEFYLNNDKQYNEIIDKNYKYVLNNHSWSKRLDSLISKIY